MNSLEFKKNRKDLGLTQKEVAKMLGVNKNTISNYENGGKIPDSKIPLIISFFNSQTNSNPNIKNEGHIVDEDNLPIKEVVIIDRKGRGGLENAFFDKMYMDKLNRETLTIKKESSIGSEWFKIEVEGVSMDDSTSDFEGSKYSLSEGDWVYCRSIPKIHWRNKLHFNSVKIFCFFHNTKGILFKKVISHNIENGELILSSLNKDKKKFPDFKINVSECSYILNVIKVLSEF